jgi:hypothetical protein
METVVLGIGSFSSRRTVVDPRSVWNLSLLAFHCGQCIVGWWRNDGLDTRENVCDVVLSRGVSDVSREFSWEAFVPFLPEGVGDRFVVCEDAEVAHFQHVAEILYGLIDDQKLAVICTNQ